MSDGAPRAAPKLAPAVLAEARREYHRRMAGVETDEAAWAQHQEWERAWREQGRFSLGGRWLTIQPARAVSAVGVLAAQGGRPGLAGAGRLGIIAALVLLWVGIGGLWWWPKGAASPAREPPGTPTLAPVTPAPDLGQIADAAGPLPAVRPNKLVLEAAGPRPAVQWPVEASAVVEGTWRLRPDATTAAWIAGTRVTWDLGLWASAANTARVRAVQAGDTATLWMTPGQDRRTFRLGAPAAVPRWQTALLDQRRPGFVLAVLGDPSVETRWVLTGTEVLPALGGLPAP